MNLPAPIINQIVEQQERIAQLEAELATMRDQRDAYAADVSEWHDWLASVIGENSSKEAMRAKLAEARKLKLCETCYHYSHEYGGQCFRKGVAIIQPPPTFGCVYHLTQESK